MPKIGYKKKIIISSVLLFNALLCAFSITLSWFINETMRNIGAEASINRNYFEGGNGSSDEPFLIKYPVQYYYFTWLQNMGYFNREDELNPGNYKQYHFKIIDDLDMKDYILPPVGTNDYPFIGHLDGDGHIINNLKVTNETDRYTDQPLNINNENRNYQIVGAFGVVGSYGNMPYTYQESSNSIHDFTINNASISSITPLNNRTLIGLAVGYLNGYSSNVYVDNSNLKIGSNISCLDASNLTSNRSDHSLVGYVTNRYLTTSKIKSRYVADPKFIEKEVDYSELQGTAWGGSIDMYTMYTRLDNVRTNLASAIRYVSHETIENFLDGTSSTSYTFSNSQLFREYVSSDNMSQFTFNSYTTAGNYTVNFIYLYGKESENFPATNKTVTTINHLNESGYYIGFNMNNVTHYLTLNDETTIKDTTSLSEATVWKYENNYLSTIYKGVTRYITYSAGNIVLSTNNTTPLTRNNNNFYYQTGGSNYYISYDGRWLFNKDYPITNINKNYIRVNNNYLSINNGQIVNNTSTTNATLWEIDTANNQIYGDGYYLSGSTTLALSTTPFTFTSVTLSGTTLTAYNYYSSRYNYYLYYSSNAWRLLYRRNNNPATCTVTSFSGTGTYTLTNGTQTLDRYDEDVSAAYDTVGTYFPIICDDNFAPSFNNTGYVISGKEYKASDNSLTRSGDIRVSRYSKSDISGSWNTSTNDFRVIRTVNDNGYTNVIQDTNDFVKYNSSKESLKRILSESGNYVHGLHFMNADIDKNNHILGNVRLYDINSPTGVSEYNNYQLPQDCIDFHLQEKGYINFFAGDYFPGNSSFFSLHRIFRDENNPRIILDIKHILKIYKHKTDLTEDYLYLYDDGTYSNSSFSISDYELLFDLNWIEQPGFNSDSTYIYYFEIPVNKGEYALGSVSGRAGAYLLYLDISAGAVKLKRSQTSETFKLVTSNHSYSVGICFINTAALDLNEKAKASIIVLDNSSSVDINFDLDENHHLIIDDVVNSIPTYIDNGFSFIDSGNNLIDHIENIDNKTTLISIRKTNRDYDKVNDTTTLTKEYINLYIDENNVTTRECIVYNESMEDVSFRYPYRGLNENNQIIIPTYETNKQILRYKYKVNSENQDVIVNVKYRFEISNFAYSDYSNFVISSYNYKCIIEVTCSEEVIVFFENLDPNYVYEINGQTISSSTNTLIISPTSGLVEQNIFPLIEDIYDDDDGEGNGIWRVL